MPMTIVRVLPFAPGSADPQTLSLGSAVASGNALVVVIRTFTTTTVAGVSDNGGATPVYDQDHTFTQQSSANGYIYSRRNITDAPTSVSVDISASAAIRGFVMEVSGMAATSHVGQTYAIASPGSSTAAPQASFTTANANELAVAILEVSNSRTITPDSGYSLTHVSTAPSNFALIYDEDVGAAGAKTIGGTYSVATNAWMNGVTYLAASGGGSSPLNKIMMYHGG